MNIGLVRHFKVDLYKEDNLSLGEYNEFMFDYDYANIIETEVNLREIDWNMAFSSSLPRAIYTAEAIYSKSDIIKSDLLREVDIRIKEEIKEEMSLFKWFELAIDSWEKNLGLTLESKEYSRERIKKFSNKYLDKLSEEDNVLIVCHGIIMRVLEEELRIRGFKGEKVGLPENGQLILLSK